MGPHSDVYRCAPMMGRPIGDAYQIVYFPLRPSTHILLASDVKMLSACREFKPLTAHAEELSRTTYGTMADPIERLTQLAAIGALISSGEVLGSCNRAASVQQHDTHISWLAIPTCGRPLQLSRAIESYAANLRQFDREVRFFIADDSGPRLPIILTTTSLARHRMGTITPLGLAVTRASRSPGTATAPSGIATTDIRAVPLMECALDHSGSQCHQVRHYCLVGEMRFRDGGTPPQEASGRHIRGPARVLRMAAGLIASVLFGYSLNGIGSAQPSGGPADPSFEVVSVKPSGDTRIVVPPGGGVVIRQSGAFRITDQRLTCNLPLESIIEEAFSTKGMQLIAPQWIWSETYMVAAVMPVGTSRDDARLMLRSMLRDRFGFKFHREQRDIPVYALVQTKSGFKLRKVDPEEAGKQITETPAGPMRAASRQGPGHYIATAIPISGFAEWLSIHADRPVLDMTGIEGAYRIDLRWSPEQHDSSDFATIVGLVQRELGLRLEKRKVFSEVMVVDHIDQKPTEN